MREQSSQTKGVYVIGTTKLCKSMWLFMQYLHSKQQQKRNEKEFAFEQQLFYCPLWWQAASIENSHVTFFPLFVHWTYIRCLVYLPWPITSFKNLFFTCCFSLRYSLCCLFFIQFNRFYFLPTHLECLFYCRMIDLTSVFVFSISENQINIIIPVASAKTHKIWKLWPVNKRN